MVNTDELWQEEREKEKERERERERKKKKSISCMYIITNPYTFTYMHVCKQLCMNKSIYVRYYVRI